MSSIFQRAENDGPNDLRESASRLRALSPVVVINQYDGSLEGFTAARLGQFLSTDQLMTISADKESVNRSINCGKPLRLVAPHSPALTDIVSLAEELLGKRLAQHSRGILGSVFHALGVDRLTTH